MNWGKGLIVAMGLFMAFIFTMGYFMISKSEGLVEKDYYEKGNQYDTQYQEMQNALGDSLMKFETVDGKYRITFRTDVTGEAICLRPDNNQLDFQLPITTDNAHTFSIPLAARARGKWKVRLKWKENGKDMLKETDVYIP